ncbi:MAG: fatty acid cis/trans isomerase, partial [Proteobacteria bacterium]|nr:fatty acid cis/trans isomerase [Pseudomonadota bacterium]
MGQAPVALAGEYEESIKPIFEARCIACHSCYNAPCQLNLQSFAGAERGATSQNVYDASRVRSTPLTRLGIDATSTSAWRSKGFFDVLGDGNPDRSLLMRMVRMRSDHASLRPSKQVSDSRVCVPAVDDRSLSGDDPSLAM